MQAATNVEVVQQIFAAVNRGDFDAALANMTEDVVVDFSASESPYSGVYEGRASVRRFWSEFISSWDQVAWEAEDVREVPPNLVVCVNHVTGRGLGSGIEVDARGGHVWEVTDGLVSRMTLYQSGDDARHSAGIDG